MNETRARAPSQATRKTIDAANGDETRGNCPECDGALVPDEKRGETTCSGCGLVIEEELVDRGPEWRVFGAGERNQRSRVGAPVTERRHDHGLSATIDWRNEDAYGNRLSEKRRRQFRRLRLWDARFVAKSPQERNLKHAFGEIDRMASALGISESCRETACVIYRQAVEAELLPGRTIEGMATASVYAAARQHGTPRTLVEFETVSRVDKLRIQRAYRNLSRELGLRMEPPDPVRYVPQLASQLGASDEAERLARELVEAAKAETLHIGRNPASIAAAAMYAASQLANDTVTQDEVSDAAHVSEITIRNRYTEILDAFEKQDSS